VARPPRRSPAQRPPRPVPVSHGRSPAMFLKWAGGKTALLPELFARLPERFGRYFEPFVGAGALFFALADNGRLAAEIHLADVNQPLIDTYRAVAHDVDAVIHELQQHRNESSYFYEVRAWDPAALPLAKRAARFIFLNQTAFNGLYRENKRGLFNVPFGRYKNPNFCNERALRAAAHRLAGVTLDCADFAASVERAWAGDFVYFDPPYVPRDATSYFTSYSRGGFDEGDQRRLAAVFRTLAARGVHVLLSNSDTPLVRELYDGFKIDTVYVRRNINSKGDARGEVPEVLVSAISSSDSTVAGGILTCG
jgi:DNA adenine methylase